MAAGLRDDFCVQLDIFGVILITQHVLCATRQKSTGDLVAQGSHVEYSAGGDTYPDSMEEYHKLRVARQKSKL